MQGLSKIVAFTAPAVFLVILLSLYLQREHRADMQVQSSQFDRDFAEAQKSFAKTPEEKKLYQSRADEAQRQYSTAKAEVISKTKKVDQGGDDMDKAASDIDKQLQNAAEKRGR